MGREQAQKQQVADEEDWISIWLRNAETHQDEEGVSELGDAATVGPITPPRRVSLTDYYQEASPTNTSFSGGSVFDKPQCPGQGWIEDVSCDDIPDEVPDVDKSKVLEIVAHTDRSTDRFKARSLSSYDPPSEATGYVEEIASVQEGASKSTTNQLLDPDKPRPTWLTSCTQCIHADMPCSRKAPACSRCRRKGQAALCLLHRRPYPEEILESDATWSTAIVLLKLKAEDEETWKAKLRVANELQNSWHARNDRKNWVLPSVESPRGTFRSSRTQEQKSYPGEGRGEREDRCSYQELCVVIDG